MKDGHRFQEPEASPFHFHDVVRPPRTTMGQLVLFAITLALYVFSYLLGDVLAVLPLRAASGFLLFIVFPGSILVEHLFPDSLQNLWMSLVMGMAFCILSMQLLFTLSITMTLHVPLVLWLMITSVGIVGPGHLSRLLGGRDDALARTLRTQLGLGTLKWIAVGLLLRFGLALLATDCIAPDASVYADFSRGILNGTFQSGVLNDNTVIDVGNGVEFLAHIGFVYLFSVSWLILPPSLSGPVLILIIAGVALIAIASQFSRILLGDGAEWWTACLVSIHPLFVFHSAVAYGPEMTSLLFLVCGLYLLAHLKKGQVLLPLVTGVLIGVVDVVWYTNFLIVTVTLPLLLLFVGGYARGEIVALTVISGLILAMRVFYNSFSIFVIVCLVGLVLVGAFHRLDTSHRHRELGFFFVGVISSVFFWRWPIQLNASFSSMSLAGPSAAWPLVIDFSGIINAVFAPIDIAAMIRMPLFTLFHVSVLILLFSVSTLLRGDRETRWYVLLIVVVVILGGTLKVLMSFGKDVLLAIYIYSDSRFLLLPVLLIVLPASSWLCRKENEPRPIRLPHLRVVNRREMVVALLVLSLIPNYAAIPTGLELVRIEDRYGWSGLKDAVDGLATEGDVFLADRAGEFTWLTGIQSVVLRVFSGDNTTARALLRVLRAQRTYAPDYFLLDGYTTAHLGAMHTVLTARLSIGTHVPLDTAVFKDLSGNQQVNLVPSLILRAQTIPGPFGDYSRVFEFGTANYTLSWQLEDLSGWLADNGGYVTNSSGTPTLVIGDEADSTCMMRVPSMFLSVDIDSGFFLCHLNETLATMDGLEILDTDGRTVGVGEPLDGGYYFVILGDACIGDIKLCARGVSGSGLGIDYFALWSR